MNALCQCGLFHYTSSILQFSSSSSIRTCSSVLVLLPLEPPAFLKCVGIQIGVLLGLAPLLASSTGPGAYILGTVRTFLEVLPDVSSSITRTLDLTTKLDILRHSRFKFPYITYKPTRGPSHISKPRQIRIFKSERPLPFDTCTLRVNRNVQQRASSLPD